LRDAHVGLEADEHNGAPSCGTDRLDCGVAAGQAERGLAVDGRVRAEAFEYAGLGCAVAVSALLNDNGWHVDERRESSQPGDPLTVAAAEARSSSVIFA
jgi:hypothetical protein